jgi:hypothetical protein
MGSLILSYGWTTEREHEEQGTQVLHLDGPPWPEFLLLV